MKATLLSLLGGALIMMKAPAMVTAQQVQPPATTTTTCTFDAAPSICGWTVSGKAKWKRGTKTPSSGTGANQAQSGKYFMYLETTGGHHTDVSYLTSPALPAGTRSMSFWYHMHGQTVGKLSVDAYLSASQTWVATGWSLSGQQHVAQAHAWIPANLSVPSGATKVRFVGTDADGTVTVNGKASRYKGWQGDISVDTVSFSTAKFLHQGPKCKCQGGVPNVASCPKDGAELCAACNVGFMMTSTICAKVIGQSSCTGADILNPSKTACVNPGCSFDKDAKLCGWTSIGADSYRRWTRGTKTPSSNTGALKAQSGSHFMYLETTGGKRGDTSYLISPVLAPVNQSMTFFSHRHGGHIGSLAVEVLRRDKTRLGWYPTGWMVGRSVVGGVFGVQLDEWHIGKVLLPPATLRVRFVGKRGSSWQGDISVDTITLSVMVGSTNRCGAGWYKRHQPNVLSAVCEICPAGRFGEECQGTCPSGSYSPERSEKTNACAECISGRYDDDICASTPCVSCPAGRFSNATGSTECRGSCPSGTYAAPGSVDSNACAQCQAGKYDFDSSASTPCVSCPAGRFSNATAVVTGSSSGRFSDTAGLTVPCQGYCHSGSHDARLITYLKITQDGPVGSKRGSWDLYEVTCWELGKSGKQIKMSVHSFSHETLKYPASNLVDNRKDTFWAGDWNRCTHAQHGACQWVILKFAWAVVDFKCTLSQAAVDPRWAVQQIIIATASSDRPVFTSPIVKRLTLGDTPNIMPNLTVPTTGSCTSCRPGQYDHDNSSSTPCVSCPAGRFSNTTGANKCQGTCSNGTYAPPGSMRSTACIQCGPGQYDHDNSASTPCAFCPVGQVSHFAGSTQCQRSCSSGTYAPPGSITCIECRPGQYDHDSSASTPCVSCLAGRFSNATGSVTCDGVCPVDTYSFAGSQAAADCLPFPNDTIPVLRTDAEGMVTPDIFAREWRNGSDPILWEQSAPGKPWSTGVVAGDFNGDRLTDLYVTCSAGAWSWDLKPMRNRLFFGTKSGGFDEQISGPAVTTLSRSVRAVIGDFNADK
eukprot:COSAG01_NODE_994_length_12252_cov_10.271044_1_plen_1040_part_10